MNKLAQLSIIVLLPLAVGLITYVRFTQEQLKDIRITYEQEVAQAQHFISTEQVRNTVLAGEPMERVFTKDIDLLSVEARIAQHPLVEKAQAYLGLGGILHIRIKERNPVARVAVGKGFVYMDSQGKEMPLSPFYAKRVVLISGIKQATPSWSEAFQIANTIEHDDFLRENITHVWYQNNQFYLQMREGSFVVNIGDNAQGVQQKFNNLKAFYKKAQRDHFLGKYKEINLQYSNQVVCIK